MKTEEIHEILAEFENRLALLEALHTRPNGEAFDIAQNNEDIFQENKHLPLWWDRLTQLEGRIVHIQNKLYEWTDKSKRKSRQALKAYKGIKTNA